MKRVVYTVLCVLGVQLLVAAVGGVWFFSTPDDALDTVVVSRGWMAKLYVERMQEKGRMLELMQQLEELQKQLYSSEQAQRTSW